MARSAGRDVSAALAGLGAAGALLVGCTSDSPHASTFAAGASSDGSPRAGSCTRDEECANDGYCLFSVGAACGSTGTCMTVPQNGPSCADAYLLDPTQETSCSCDGTPRYQPCALPFGYTRGVILHPGACADGGEVCDPTAKNCPDDEICGFRVSDGCSVTTAHCYDGVDPTTGGSGVLLGVCGCDGGEGSTFPGTLLYATVPVRDLGSCRVVDAGPDASDAAAAAD